MGLTRGLSERGSVYSYYCLDFGGIVYKDVSVPLVCRLRV